MRILVLAIVATAFALAAARAASAQTTATFEGDAKAAPPSVVVALKGPADFRKIHSRKARSIALFEEASKVITHPRCMNCHPATERPTQTDAMLPHQPWVVRGVSGNGAPALRCQTCHHDTNYDVAGVPGHPRWTVAPASMAWQGKSHRQICEQLLDKRRNGGMNKAALIHHMAADSLVGWAWNPGAGREPAPGTQAQFGLLITAWLTDGGHCPP
jgi:hypothetical protein